MNPPDILFYGDDFTGATDTLATAARAGLRTLLFLQLPTRARLAAAGALDCIGIAGASRSMTPAEMRVELEPVAAFFVRLGAGVLHYKTCSTFDSAPGVGSIGVAVEVLRTAVSEHWAAIVGGQPDLERYCLFGNLFAAAGSGGEVHRIDRHPTMSRHPVTPMHEADLRRHFALQGLCGIRAMTRPTYARGAAVFDEALEDALSTQPDAVLFDVADNGDLAFIGRALRRRTAAVAPDATLLVVGPSSVVQALAPTRAVTADARPIAPAAGPVLVLAGSLSPVTARQVAAARSFDIVRFDASRLAVEPDYRASVAADLASRLAAGRNVLGCTVAADGDAASATASASAPDIPARELARAVGDVLVRVLDIAPLARIGVAGGDTSSHAVLALEAWGLSYSAALSPGVALCRLHSDRPSLDGVEIMLKGGQMGSVDIFERLVYGTV